MTADKQPSQDATTCPNCGGVVVYRGVGRRPIWCSTRCRNDASLRRLGARKGAVEVRVVEIARHRSGAQPEASGPAAHQTKKPPDTLEDGGRGAATLSAEQALRVIRNDPQAIGKLLSHLERRRSEGSLLTPEWLPVRNALRLLAGGLPPDVEHPA